MKRGLLVGLGVALAALVGLSTGVLAGDWTQPRGDAAATGFQAEEGPEWPDVALRVELDGSWQAEADAPPLILDDEILFLARPSNDPADDDYRVFSVDPDTGDVEIVAEGVERTNRLRMATDGETLYVSGRGTVHAFPLGPEGDEWTWEGRKEAQGVEEDEWRAEWCGWMALEAAHVTVMCWIEPIEQTQCGGTPSLCPSRGHHTLVARLDAETGEPVWEPWTVPYDPSSEADAEDHSGRASPTGLAVSQSRIVALTSSGGWTGDYNVDPAYDVRVGGFQNDAWGIDGETGELEWNRTLQSADTRSVGAGGETVADETEPFRNVGNPAIADGAAYIKAGQVHKLNLGTGAPLWSQPIGEEDVDPEGGRSGAVSLTDEHVFTTSAQTLYRIHAEAPEEGWSNSLNFSEEEGFDEQPIVTPRTVYAVIEAEGEQETVIAFDAERGDEVWRHGSQGDVFSSSLGHGLLSYTETTSRDDGTNTSLVLLGRTNASPTVTADVPETYPDAGEEVTVDLSRSEAGLEGPVTRYKAIWGDGTETDWKEDPVLTHAYEDDGSTEARFVVANEANQTASTTQTFHVGESQPNWLSERFEPENQEMTFGVLGIAMALGGGLIGVGRRYRKRSRLEDELEALEQGFEETKDDPGECEAFLDNRKARARSLAIDGYLEEQHVPVIESRAEELRGQLRTGMLDERFQFLPHGMVQSLKRMLEDGQINAWERDTIETLLEEDEALNAAQKERVRGLLERWSASGGPDGGGSS